MDRSSVGERAFATAAPASHAEAIEFVRFCHRRRRVGWPELYDEMCAVAGRGLYRGYGPEELAAIGIGLGLFQMPALAGLVAQVVAEDLERRRRTAEALRAEAAAQALVASADVTAPESPAEGVHPAAVVEPVRRVIEPEPVDAGMPDHGSFRVALAGA
jgi:hypothetical protein